MLAILAVALGMGAESAHASYSAQVRGGTLVVTGDKDADTLALRLTTPTTLAVTDGSAEHTFDKATFTAIDVDAGAGDDTVRIDQSGGAILDEQITLAGGSGNDTLVGGVGVERLEGDGGHDLLDANAGLDAMYGGPGNDRFQWDPGDASDTVAGEAGRDELDFNASNASERIDVLADGKLLRNIGSVTLDLGTVERLNFRPLAGTDTIALADLTRTDIQTVAVDNPADTAADVIQVAGTSGVDRVSATSDLPGGVRIDGLAADVLVGGGDPLDVVEIPLLGGADTITSSVLLDTPFAVRADGGDGTDSARFTGSEGDDTIGIVPNGGAVRTGLSLDTAAVESLAVLPGAGNDTVHGLNGLAALTSLTIDGGEGDDTLGGGDGADRILGRAGNDRIDGNRGNDDAQLGDGDDRFQWDPGDGNDSVNGQTGADALDFNASNAGERIDIFRNGSRVKLQRDIASITMDFDSLETVGLRMLGGTDTIAIDDLSRTDVALVDVALAAFDGTPDGVADRVSINGTSRPDVFDVIRSGQDVLTRGLRVTGSEPADTLQINTLAGDDEVTVGPGVADLITPSIDLGLGG